MNEPIQKELRELLTEENQDILRFDSLLGELHKRLNAELVGQLFDLFTDEPLVQDEMWSLVHLVEYLPDPVYVKSLFVSIGRIQLKAPEWASILAIRVLNSEGARKTLKERFASATNQDRDIWRNVLLSIAAEDVSFSPAIKQILGKS